METIGNIDLVPADRRVSGQWPRCLMAPLTHTSPDRPGRFSDGHLGVLYIAADFDTVAHETAHHHTRFMAATQEKPDWTSQFRELLMDVEAPLHGLRDNPQAYAAALDPDDYMAAQQMAAALRAKSSQGVCYPSVREQGDCLGPFFPDIAHNVMQGRHLDYHWDGHRVDLIRDATNGDAIRVVDEPD